MKMPGDGSGINRVGTWHNPLLEAGRRNRFYLENGARAAGSRVGAVEILGNVDIYPEVGNVEILGGPEAHISSTGRAMMPLTDPLMREVPRPMFRSMVRLMGESSIQQRRWGNRSLWQGTPIASLVPAGLGEPFDVTYDAAELLAGVESLGWEWDFKADVLKAYVTTSRGMTTVTIPGAKVKAIFMRAFEEAYGVLAPQRFRNKATCGDLLSDIGNFFTKDIPKAVNNVQAGIGSFVKNPGKWIEGAAKDIGRIAEDVVSNVVASEVFAGVMGALAVIPPLTAVGGVGLAAYGIAKTAKTVINAAKSVVSTVESVAKATQGRPAPKALPAKSGKAPLTPRPLTASEVASIQRTPEWVKFQKTLPVLANTIPNIPQKRQMLENAVLQALATIATKKGYFKEKKPNWAATQAADKQRKAMAKTAERSRVVAKIGPRAVPVTVVSKRRTGELEPRVVSPQAEARVVSAVEELKAKLNQWSQENTPYSRLMLSGMQTVPA